MKDIDVEKVRNDDYCSLKIVSVMDLLVRFIRWVSERDDMIWIVCVY